MSVRLGDTLVERGLATDADVAEALAEQTATGDRLGEILVHRGVIAEEDLFKILAEQVGVPFVDLTTTTPDPTVRTIFRETLARRLGAVALGWDDGRLVVAMANPGDVFALDDLRMMARAELQPRLAPPSQIAKMLDRLFGDGDRSEVALRAATADADPIDLNAEVSDGSNVDDDSVVRFVNELIGRAVRCRASDIHLDPTEDGIRVRFRLDGVLHDVMNVPGVLRKRVVGRIKIMGSMDVADRRAPQDGRIAARIDGRNIDIRVVSFPTAYGEAVAMRILDNTRGVHDIHKLGFRPDALVRYEKAFRRSHGLIVLAGPTGSGKSTTLYATLRELNTPDRNIITVEDPIEYVLAGVKHMQVEPRAGVTFAKALRSLLRADPDVLMVGEVRDAETARLAIDAALTGHLVLTSLHTQSAAATPARLVQMGIEPYLITAALQCVVTQRLVRRLCESCRVRQDLTDADLARLDWPEEDEAVSGQVFFTAVGCEACSDTGYIGRAAIHEVMPVSEAIAQGIAAEIPTAELERLALSEGMVTLRHDGLRKAGAGITTIAEVERVAS